MVANRRFEASPETILRELGSVLRKMEAERPRIETAAKLSKEYTAKLGKIGVQVRAADPLLLPAPAVRVVFERFGKPFPYECAKWGVVIDNLRACQLTISRLYSIYEDYGVTGDQSGTGGAAGAAARSFEQIFSLGAGEFRWWEILGVAAHAPSEAIRKAYRDLAQVHHPDKGGSRADFDRVQRAYDEAMSERGER